MEKRLRHISFSFCCLLEFIAFEMFLFFVLSEDVDLFEGRSMVDDDDDAWLLRMEGWMDGLMDGIPCTLAGWS